MVASVACFIQIFGIGNKSQKSESFIGADRMDDQIRNPASLPMLEDAWVVKTSRGRILCIAPVRRRVAAALEIMARPMRRRFECLLSGQRVISCRSSKDENVASKVLPVPSGHQGCN